MAAWCARCGARLNGGQRRRTACPSCLTIYDEDRMERRHCTRCGALLARDGMCGECRDRHLDRVSRLASAVLG